MSKPPEYRTWVGMRNRCLSRTNPAYKYYGGRGIKICTRWLSNFDAFYADMGPRPGPEYSINRKDNDGDYSPDNCEWATKEVQIRNRRQRGSSSIPEHQMSDKKLQEIIEKTCNAIQPVQL